jgi:hypothetical protein
MNEQHPSIDRLNEYLDQDLDSRERRRIDAHLAGCDECRKTVQDLTAIVRAAGELAPVTPPERVWESISASLIERKTLGSGRHRYLPALALAATVLLAVTLWFALRQGQPGIGTDPDEQEALADMVTEELKAAESHYDKAIVGLEQIIAQNDQVLPQEVASVLNQNLDLIENAIGESRTAIESQPRSAAAQESLLQALKSKVTLLQNTILLINEIRKGQGENALDLIDEMRNPDEPGSPI